MSLKQRALRGATWAVAGGNASQLLAFVMFVAISRVVGPEVATELVRAFVGARFSGEERHRRRLGKLNAIEERSMGVKEERHA